MIREKESGQSLVVFVLLLPVILAIIFLVIEQLYILNHKRKLADIGKIVCEYALQDTEFTKIQQLALDNDSEIDNFQMESNEGKIQVSFKKLVPSIFGKIIGYQTYSLHTHVQCNQE